MSCNGISYPNSSKNMLSGIRIYGILSVIFSLALFSFIVVPEIVHHPPDMFTIAYSLTAVCWMVFGIGVIKRLSWARIGLIFIAAIYTIDSIERPSHIVSAIKNHQIGSLVAVVTSLIFFISLIIFFTRAKIKQQFVKRQIMKCE